MRKKLNRFLERSKGEQKIYNIVYYNSFNKGLTEVLSFLQNTENIKIKLFVIDQKEKIETQTKILN